MGTPLQEVALLNPGALEVLEAHPDLTELCRKHGIVGDLVWVFYKEICNSDPQLMKQLLFNSETLVKKMVRKREKANQVFLQELHPYAKFPTKKRHKSKTK